ncbi:Blp family class II bacteriocin [Alteromonas facilis]|uniref:Blp family class II bacteriocin n=1 Tax=Alteromonas facilis TaxID=2048004 RepID=UPI000F5C72B8|nr:Blp family class II bacteriocin [Alteromonas facilis]
MMNTLSNEELESVSGGCAEHCWGDFSAAGFGASVVAGAIGGMRGGFVSMALGAVAGGLGYAGSKVGDKMSERTTGSSDE